MSCQASAGEPLNAPEHIVALSLSAIAGGACALRLEGAENIACVRRESDATLVGLTKSASVPDRERLSRVYITATFAEAEHIARAGADVIAGDATGRPRPDGLSLKDFIARIHGELGKPFWADVATLDEGVAAAEAGADLVSTTMYGYTEGTNLPSDAPPDFDLLARLCRELAVPVVLEGRVWHPDEVANAFTCGAHAVVVGSAITRPQLITRRFVKATPGRS